MTLSILPLYHRAVPTTVPYVVMGTHMLSDVFLRRLILSVSQTVINLKTKPHLPIAAHTVHTVRVREAAGDHSRIQASFIALHRLLSGYFPSDSVASAPDP